jgi:predicted nucleic acid-binding protein
MFVVADTSPINYLILIHQDTLLPLFYERVVIPHPERRLQDRLGG